MKTIILAGGFGTRISEYTNNIPKPMINVNGKPILWHIMNLYNRFNHKDFYLALGYKGEVIKNYFLNYKFINSDLNVNLASGEVKTFSSPSLDWNVNLIDTGLNTMTGGRIKRLKDYIGDQTFMVTYGDGLGNINFDELISFHKSHGKMVTITSVKPTARFGELDILNEDVLSFAEKPKSLNSWISGGFFVMEPDIFNLIDSDSTMLEKEPLEKVASIGQLKAFKHKGFWQCMDSKRDHEILEKLSKVDPPPWVIKN